MASTAEEQALPALRNRRLRPLLFGSALVLAIIAIVSIAYAVPYHYTLDLGSATDRLEPTYLSRFNPAERSTVRDIRWSQGDSFVRLLPIATTVRATITYIDAPPGSPQRIARFATNDGQDVTLQPIGATGQPLTLTLDVPTRSIPYILTGNGGKVYEIWFGGMIEIQVPLLQAKNDTRPLGVAIDKIEIEAQQDGLFAPLCVLLLFLFVNLMPYTLLLSLRVRALWAFLPALALTAGEGALLAMGRRSMLDLTSQLLIVAVLGYYAAFFIATRRAFIINRAAERIPTRAAVSSSMTYVKNGEALAPTRLATQPNGVLILWVLRVIAVVVTALVCIAPLLPNVGPLASRPKVLPMYVPWWQFYNALPLWFVILSTLIVLAALLPLRWYASAASLLKNRPIFTLPQRRWRGIRLDYAIIALVSLPIFWLLRVHQSAGDSVNVVGALVRHTFYENEFLEYCFHTYIYRAFEAIMHPVSLYDKNQLAQNAYAVPSVLMGGLFVYVTLLLSERLADTLLARAVIAGFVLTAGTMLLYFGYIESYPTAYLVALIFIYTAIGAIQDRQATIMWPALWLALAIVLHQQMLFLGPAFVFVLWLRATEPGRVDWRRLGREVAESLIVGIAPLLLLWAMAVNLEYTLARWYDFSRLFGGGTDGGYFKPLFQATTPEESYPVVSWQYLAQIANIQFLLAPLSLAVILMIAGMPALLHNRFPRSISGLVAAGVLLFYVSLILNGKRPFLPVTILAIALLAAALWLGRNRLERLSDPMLAFLAIVALFTFIFSAAWNPDMGWGDWDLLSANGICTSLLAGYSLAKYGGRSGWLARAALIALPFLGVHFAGWVVANAFGLAQF